MFKNRIFAAACFTYKAINDFVMLFA